MGSRGSLRDDHCRPLGQLLISPDDLPTPVLGGLVFGRPLSPVAVSHHLQHLEGPMIGYLHKPLWGDGISVADEISIVGGAQVVYYLHIRRVLWRQWWRDEINSAWYMLTVRKESPVRVLAAHVQLQVDTVAKAGQ